MTDEDRQIAVARVLGFDDRQDGPLHWWVGPDNYHDEELPDFQTWEWAGKMMKFAGNHESVNDVVLFSEWGKDQMWLARFRGIYGPSGKGGHGVSSCGPEAVYIAFGHTFVEGWL